MFWSVELPFVLTLCCLVVAVVGATAGAPRLGQRRARVFQWSLLLAVLAFVPSCTAIMRVANAIRFGVGQYENVDAIWDAKFGRWLPESARDIVMQTRINGYRARFKIDRQALENWFDRCWANAKETARPLSEPTVVANFDSTKMEQHFGELGDAGRSEESNWVLYEGPRKLNWAGASTWFNEKLGVAYQEASFW